MSAEEASYDPGQLQVIEWNMLDKRKFYPLSLTCSICVRGLLYPLTVVKTRIQIQRRNTIYRGTFDAFFKILNSEGISGLYRGYWINTFQVVSGVFYVTTYETVRHFLANFTSVQDNRLRALIGGGCASLVGQTIIVPFDVISQHMMMIGNVSRRDPKAAALTSDTLDLARRLSDKQVAAPAKKRSLAMAVIREIYFRDGILGFYRGYLASALCYVPNSALFWGFYSFYADLFTQLAPQETSRLLLQMVAAPTASVTTTMLTNPFDLVRARLQVQRLSLSETSRILWNEERWNILTKGLSARMLTSSMFSLFIITGYESLKRVSVRSDYKGTVRW